MLRISLLLTLALQNWDIDAAMLQIYGEKHKSSIQDND